HQGTGTERTVAAGYRRQWSTVYLCTAGEHGDVLRVAQVAGDELAGPAGELQERLDVLLVPSRAGDLGDPVEQCAHAGDVLDREVVRIDRGDRPGQAHDRVLVVGDRAVAGAAVGAQATPGHTLLGGLGQVGAHVLAGVRLRQGDRVAAHLADRLGHAVEDLGMVLHQPLSAPHTAVLLVGEEGEHQIAGRDLPGAGEVPGDGEDHRD